MVLKKYLVEVEICYMCKEFIVDIKIEQTWCDDYPCIKILKIVENQIDQHVIVETIEHLKKIKYVNKVVWGC